MVSRFVSVCLVWVLLAFPAAASGVALFIVNERYDSIREARGASGVLDAARRLESAGFSVDQATDLSAPAMRAALSGLSEAIRRSGHERVMIVYSGHVVHSAQGAWLMGVDSGNVDLANVDNTGVRLETVLAIAEQLQGGAVVAIADFGFPAGVGAGLQAGLPAGLSVPQGVSVAHGPATQLVGFLRALSVPGTTLRAAAENLRQVRIEGFNPPYLAFLPAGHEPAVDADRRAWEEATEIDTAAAYRTYLDEFPDGQYAETARAAIARLENTPERIENALNLTRDERRAIQRDLTILNFNPRGIDGIFGPATRSAITAWQGRNSYAATGFLDRDQIFQLASQAARRAAELEAEARARQVEEERRDRAYWRDTGAGQDEAGLRAYIERFPDGIFSNIARERLSEIEEARRQAAQARDRAAWDIAQREDSVQSYERYLRDFPSGAFADQARARIEELTRPSRPRPDIDAARAEEEAMRLPGFTILIIEQRLAALGFDPGALDGRIDSDTRRAIRRYQRASDLPVTGYLTQGIVARLMAEGVLRMFE